LVWPGPPGGSMGRNCFAQCLQSFDPTFVVRVEFHRAAIVFHRFGLVPFGRITFPHAVINVVAEGEGFDIQREHCFGIFKLFFSEVIIPQSVELVFVEDVVCRILAGGLLEF